MEGTDHSSLVREVATIEGAQGYGEGKPREMTIIKDLLENGRNILAAGKPVKFSECLRILKARFVRKNVNIIPMRTTLSQ